MSKSAPYFFKRYVFFNKNATLDPLYQFDTGVYDETTGRIVEAPSGVRGNANSGTAAPTHHETEKDERDAAAPA